MLRKLSRRLRNLKADDNAFVITGTLIIGILIILVGFGFGIFFIMNIVNIGMGVIMIGIGILAMGVGVTMLKKGMDWKKKGA